MKSISISVEAAGVQSAARNVNSLSAPFDRRLLAIGLGVFAGYYLGAKIGFALTFKPHPISILWPPNSILIAALLLTPPRIWWFVLLSAFPAHWAAQLQSHVPPLMISCWFISNSCEALIGAGLTRYLGGGPIDFKSLRNVGIFCLCVVSLGPFLSSFLDTAFVVWNEWGQAAYWELIRIRSFSNSVAALMVVPLILTWATDGITSLRTARRAPYLQACSLFLSLFLVSLAVLYKFGSGADSALLFLPLPFLLWAAVRFGSLGASTAISIVGFLAIWSGTHGHGPFSGETAEQNALSIQIFLIVLAVPMLFLAAVIEERASRETELRESEERMSLAANAAEMGTWLWDIVRDEIWVSEKERALFGFAPSEKPDIDRFRNAIHPDDRASMRKALENSLNTGMEYEVEHRVLLPNGQIRWLATRGRVEFGGDGKPARMRGVSFDVTRRKLGEQALSESEARFRTMADTAPVMIWMAGPDKLCNFFNKPWLEFTGRSLEQEMGNGWAEGVHPDDLQRYLKIYMEAFDARQPFAMQYRLRRHDGEYRWLSDQGVARHDTQGNFAGYIGSCVDVTELVNKDTALRESEERMRVAADAANLGIWEWDLDKDEIWATNSRRALLGWPASGKIGFEDFISRLHPDDRDRIRGAINDAINKGKDYDSEYRLVLPDGIVRWMATRGTVRLDANGKPARLLGVSIDITERKQAEEKFRLAVEASPSGIVLVDREGKIALVNTHVEELFGYRREELVGKLVDILVPERFRAIHPLRARFLAKPEADVIGAGRELFARRKDGTEFPVEIGLNPIETADGTLFLAAVADITARKQAELETLRHREELGHLSRVAAMGQLAASIAHELNQPLSGITSNASAGQRFIDRGNVDLGELRDLLGDIIADGRRAGDVIRGLQSMVKKEVRARQRVNLNELVTNVVRMVSPNAMLQTCQVETLLEPNLPEIEADAVQLQQVLLNLIINAFDAMSDTPINHRKVVIVTERSGDDAICTSVRDYGPGIPEEVGERVFEQFFTTKTRGLGMGLAIVRSIVKSHGGTITAENAEGGGARFYFTLPASAAASST
jgi:PAS domain S-box-containing protein